MIGHPNVGHVPRETLHSRQGDDLYSRCAVVMEIASGVHEISFINVTPGRTAFHVKHGVSMSLLIGNGGPRTGHT